MKQAKEKLKKKNNKNKTWASLIFVLKDANYQRFNHYNG
jgi:hypothetical protein